MRRTRLHMGLIVCCFLSVPALTGIAAPAAAAPDPEKAKQFILDGIVRTIALFKEQQLSRDEVAKRLRHQLRSDFDVATIAGYVLGPLRHKITREQKKNYLYEFEDLIVQTYTNRIFNVRPRVKSIANDIIRVTGTTPVGRDQILVQSEVNRSGANWVKIDWRLRDRNGQYLILDIIIIGISQAKVYRSEVSSILQRNGGSIEGLIAALRRKNDALREE